MSIHFKERRETYHIRRGLAVLTHEPWMQELSDKDWADLHANIDAAPEYKDIRTWVFQTIQGPRFLGMTETKKKRKSFFAFEK